jgi:hypothetical protein
MKNLFLAFYLALKEVLRNRGRFFLVSLVIALITLLVLFIAALGEGLANGKRQYVANLDAQLIVFLEKSDFVISSSRLETNTARSIRRVDGWRMPVRSTSSTEIILLKSRSKYRCWQPKKQAAQDACHHRRSDFRGGETREVVIDRNVACAIR